MSTETTKEAAEAQLRLLKLLAKEFASLHVSPTGFLLGVKCALSAGIPTPEILEALETSRSTLARWERGIGLPYRSLELEPMFAKLNQLFGRHIEATERLLEAAPRRSRPRGRNAPPQATP